MADRSREPDKDKKSKKKAFLNQGSSQEEASCLARFCFQIHSLSELVQKKSVSDQTLSEHFIELRESASVIMDQINKQKATILKQFDGWLMPIAKEVLDSLLSDAKKLRESLDETLMSEHKATTMDWMEYARCWTQLYSKWCDQKGLTQQVLQLVSDRTEQLISKDIQVIQEYQNHSLSQLSKEDEEFKDLENRLIKATEEPLKLLMGLKEQSKKPVSLNQASEWIAHLHSQRESYFDQLLVKIDSVVKDVVRSDEGRDMEAFKEMENEIKFVENELQHINQLIPKLKECEEKESYFMEMRLEGLQDHLEQFDTTYLPKGIKDRLEGLQENIQLAFLLLRKMIK